MISYIFYPIIACFSTTSIKTGNITKPLNKKKNTKLKNRLQKRNIFKLTKHVNIITFLPLSIAAKNLRESGATSLSE